MGHGVYDAANDMMLRLEGLTGEGLLFSLHALLCMIGSNGGKFL